MLRVYVCKLPRQTIIPKERLFSLAEQTKIKIGIEHLLNVGAISRVKPIKGQFISHIFTRQKKDGSCRIILNLKPLNKYVEEYHFKLEDHKTVIKLINQNYFMVTLDLQDAYLLVPINKRHRKFLRFRFNNILYEYNCMPFGLSCAPLVFTKRMKPVLIHLRGQGLISNIYLDDFLLLGHNHNACLLNLKITTQTLSNLGFIINYKKSNTVPSQVVTYLGFIYSRNLSVSLPQHKIIYLTKFITRVLSLPTCSIREFAKFIGTLISVCPAIKYGFLYTKLFEREKFLALSKGGYDSKMHLPIYLHNDLKW